MIFDRVAVIGCGLMGSGIAEVVAASGANVTVVEANDQAIDAGRTRIETSTARAEKGGKQPDGYRDRVMDNVHFTESLADIADHKLVIEAIAENEALKLDLYRRLDSTVAADAIFASNTSSLPIAKLAAVTQRPSQVVGMHFFNPVPVLKLVEIVHSLQTSPSTVDSVQQFAESQLSKVTIHAMDRSGFVVNALLVPYLISAIRMYESGFASAEDIDRGMVEGCAHPIGPLALVDLIGLDTTLAVAHSMFDEYREPFYAPPPLLARMVDAGLLGRKTGRGFYDYTEGRR
jgi:3-hydroxybutyryl-CoA dehydrogenase